MSWYTYQEIGRTHSKTPEEALQYEPTFNTMMAEQSHEVAHRTNQETPFFSFAPLDDTSAG